jgi:hypothetical protein
MALLLRCLGVGALALSFAGCQSLLGIEDTTEGEVGAADANTSGYSLSVSPTKLRVIRGQSLNVDVTVTRDSGFTEDIVVSLDGVPTGITVVGATSTAAASDVQLTVEADALSALGLADVTVTGTAGGASVPVATMLMVADPPGSLDQSFDNDGILVIPIPDASDAYVVAFDPDGNIIVGSEELDDWVVRRIGSDGTITDSITLPGIQGDLRAMAVQPDGRSTTASAVPVAAECGPARPMPRQMELRLLPMAASWRLDATASATASASCWRSPPRADWMPRLARR